MRKSYLIFILLGSAFLLILSSCANEKKSEAKGSNTKVVQKGKEVSSKVIFENDYAVVLKVSLNSGDFQAAHKGSNRVIYSLSDYSIDWEEHGKKLGDKLWKKGDVHFHEAEKHSSRNNGTTKAEWLVFSKKNQDLPDYSENAIEHDVHSVSSSFVNVLLDNADFKITEVTLPKGGSVPMHSGINRIIYSLSDYQIMYESNSMSKGEKQFKSGDIHWHEASQHALQNNGETVAKYLVVSYKQNDK